MNIIQLKNLNKIYGSGENKVEALNEINLNIKKGEMIAIVGPSGSGKSTLLNIIGLLDKQTNGEYICLENNMKNISKKEIARYRNKNFGFVIQNFALLNNYTVLENIKIPLEYGECSKKEINDRIQYLSKKLNIDNLLYKKPNKLSGGQCQRVAIARAIANNPQIILADEPTGSLDTKNGQNVINLFKEINKDGVTIIIVTHDLTIANQCNRIIELSDGKISVG